MATPVNVALVTGASRGFGRAIVIALHAAGADVVAVARNPEQLAQLRAEVGDSLTTVAADAADPVVAGSLLQEYRPRLLVLNAGARPLLRPVQHQTWQTFSRNWDVDVQHVFNWVREALLLPLDADSSVIAMSSGAAHFGSPLSGGYAGAKAAIRFISAYAADESKRAGLGIRFFALLPRLTPRTELGAMAVAAYAARSGIGVDEFMSKQAPHLEPADVAGHVLDLASSSDRSPGAYLMASEGLSLIA
jgi:NAD(P)-dependent dehydrogenase (short-subunit alcohol dehydrogenase family)